MGAKVPEDGELKRQKLTSDDLLRRQLLGKDYAKKLRDKDGHRQGDHRSVGATLLVGSKPRPALGKRKADGSSDEEGGRSSLGKKKKHHEHTKTGKDRDAEAEVGEEAMDHEDIRRERLEAAKQSKKPTNYLDEVLSRKSEKKHKSKKKRKELQEGATVSGD